MILSVTTSVYTAKVRIVKLFPTSTSSKSTLQISAAICASLAGGEKRKEYNFMISRQARYLKVINAETFLLPIEVQFRNPQFLAHDKWKEHNIISNRNQNSYNYNQICASVDCSTAKDSTDRIHNEHVY